MNKHGLPLRLILLCFLCFFPIVMHSSQSQNAGVGVFYGSTDLGNCRPPGSAAYDPATQEYTISGFGADIWDKKDAFHFLWKKLKGNFILRFEFSFLGKAVNEVRKVGWMVRNELTDDSEQINGMVHGHALTALQYRSKKGGLTESISSSDKSPTFVQFERWGNKYILSTAKVGEGLVSLEFKDATFIKDEAYVGMYICSHEDNVQEKAIIRNVSIVTPGTENH